MIILISPAKSLDFENPFPSIEAQKPSFSEESEKIAALMKKHSAKRIAKLMDISSDLASLNYQRFQSWDDPQFRSQERPCVFAYDGDVYDGLNSRSFSNQALAKARESLRIISGLYGYLRPQDLILPYRLEMGISLNVTPKKNLYRFWRPKITAAISEEMKNHEEKWIFNLASVEYNSAVDFPKLEAQVVTPLFEDWKDDNFKIISFFAKKARGMMARFLLENPPKTLGDAKKFCEAGYYFHEVRGNEWIFRRKKAEIV